MAVKRYGLFNDEGIIENVILLDQENSVWSPPEHLRLIEIPEDERIKIGDSWDGEQFTDNGPRPSSPEINLIDYAAQKRWEKEQGGITLPGGIQISTDTAAQTKVAAAKTAFDNGTLTDSIRFKAKNAWVTANSTIVTSVYQAIVSHVQNCYFIESELVNGIANNSITTTEQIDSAFSSE